jgi:glycosyltransferase involved in cell wall biosynthesis
MIRSGLSVKLLTFKKEAGLSLSEECNIPPKDWQIICFGGFFNIISWLKVFKYFIKEKPDKVFSHLWFSNAITRIICRLVGIKNVISFEHNIYDSVKTKKMYLLDSLLQNWSKKIIAVSLAVKDSLIRHGIKEKNIIVINNGINILKFSKKPIMLLKEKLGISQDTFIFLTIGRLIYQKGIDVLIEAFAKLSGNAVLLIVGHGEEEGKLKQLALKLGIIEKVQFLGIRQDIPDILAICDSFVLASRYEGLGIVVLEAMASKKSIIISDFEAGKDMITTGVDGLVVHTEDVNALALAMEKLRSDPQLRARLGQAAYKKVQDFSIQNHVNKILEV